MTHYTLKTTPAQTSRPNAGPTAKEQIEEAAAGWRTLQDGPHANASDVPEPAPIFEENKTETRANADGTVTPEPIFPEEAPRTHTDRNGHLNPGSIFDGPTDQHAPRMAEASVPVPDAIWPDGENR